MQYKSISEQNDKIILILKENDELMKMLDFIDSLKLPNYYIAAGAIFQTVWNYYDGKPLNTGIKDIDIIYFQPDDLSVEIDLKYYKIIDEFSKSLGYNFEIDVSNEARMHIWKKKNYNIEIIPYKNAEEAISRWIATVHAIGLTKENGILKLYSPYGLSDIFGRTIRPIKNSDNSKQIYDKKVNSWKERFEHLNIIEW